MRSRSMAAWVGWALWMAALLGGPAMAAPAPLSLPAEVQAALARAGLPNDALSAQVIEVDGSIPRLAYRVDASINPASIMKLITTYAALELLGPTYTWNTPVFADGAVREGVLEGNLHIKGSGDPQLVLERLWLLLRRVQQMGIVEVRGDIVLDRTAFIVPAVDPGAFDGEPLRPYNVQPEALLINYKTVALGFVPDAARGTAQVLVDPPLAGVVVDPSVPLDLMAPCADWRAALKAELTDPGRIAFHGAYSPACGEKTWQLAYVDAPNYAARAIAGLWAQLGGRLRGTVRDGVAPLHLSPLAVSTSAPLGQVVRDINKFSNNGMARQLFLTLGHVLRGVGTPATGREVVRRWIEAKWGPAPEVTLDNGAGLSRDARASVRFLSRLLQSAWAAPVMPDLVSSLPVTGQDGTLKRFTASAGTAHLKTGTLRDVQGVAGYVLAASGKRYVLVAIVNHPNAPAARAAIETLIDWTAKDVP
ncbi:D-alanyl-D-alanine carboxypeptidase/D-alanyl-D-alanine-endopeptidase [Schlegelella sp. S2-27]|uniref:D-alanyl-D-alanine carboxypeptidase/D-alanyl-D-alanine-endopeptidase n=1 Tax=Caldimonas mangrovi TaxID=2944811 RepID=A0ABT0YIK1_9BURK|nr:D-alanyl-D-alanine carboxypeptidase/D-alanyl-D-alanine-endopeptidase [Caldimonas mangrovi]MCM5678545.1 D-alanyl-D-alanine carboxypeptidase/D-alanyl-D-alanine-endopeptidase [Caldimonas mangrovi]